MNATRTCGIVTALLAATSLMAQSGRAEASLKCSDNDGDSDRHRFCEMREFPQPASPRIVADGNKNGGIRVKGWDRSDVLVRARVDVWAPSDQEARTISRQVTIQTAGGNIRADAPDFGRDRGWAVTYEIFVPTRTDLFLKAHNGGISISDVRGTIDFEGLNGGVTLQRLGGKVHGKTVNGGLHVELTGSRWDGDELNVSATNGGVSLKVPDNYSARLEASTVNGGISVDYPLSLSQPPRHELMVNLGSGGPLVRATTTNGGVSVKRKS